MTGNMKSNHEAWPAFSVSRFQQTAHLLHMGIQIAGKFMLKGPFFPHWANLAMALTARGITTGLIPLDQQFFAIDFDFISHEIICRATNGGLQTIKLQSMSVAVLAEKIFAALKKIGVTLTINNHPQEVSSSVSFTKDTRESSYDAQAVHIWWQILLKTYRVLTRFHAKFYGISPAIGLLWGTLDLRDARYRGLHLPATRETDDYIMRNSMDDAQLEVGWSCSNEKYPVPAFFAFAWPKPAAFEQADILPAGAKWIPAINEFVLDYETLRQSAHPDEDLMTFFQSCYDAVAILDHWPADLTVSGYPA